ncbi:MAG: hypothetical protein WAM85_01165 [Terracidiphilus sp.]
MKQEVYRFAYEEASSELKEIVGEFEQLRVRKERIEKVMDALKPFAGPDAPSGAGDQQTSESPYAFQQASNPSAYSY